MYYRMCEQDHVPMPSEYSDGAPTHAKRVYIFFDKTGDGRHRIMMKMTSLVGSDVGFKPPKNDADEFKTAKPK